MRKLLSCSMVMAFLCFAGPQEAAAQGWGGFWNYMNKLSGPESTGIGVNYFRETDAEFPLRVRLGVDIQRSISSDGAIDPDGSSINLFTVSLAVEKDWEVLRFGLAASETLFFGDFDDSFWHESYRAYVQLVARDFVDNLDLTVGPTLYRWPNFGATDFDPLVVDVDRTDAEYTWGLSVGIDWRP